MNHYTTLGISQNASQKEIEEAHKKLYRANHPDRFSGAKKIEAEKICKNVNEAYSVLKDPKKRKMYDMELSGTFPGNNYDQYGAQNMDFDINFGDFNTTEFTWTNTTEDRNKGRYFDLDLEKTINISLEDAYRGLKKQINYEIVINCFSCNSNGFVITNKPCKTCNGLKYMVIFFRIPCSNCNGTGKQIILCSVCKGKKYVLKTESKNLVIPAKVYNKQVLIFKHQGNKINKSTGNLKLTINVEQGKSITYDSTGKLYKEINVNLIDVLERKTLTIDIFGDIFKLTIPDTFSSQTKLVIPKKGLIFEGLQQNIYVILNVIYPVNSKK
jgi:molecular chaperone DnaJ